MSQMFQGYCQGRENSYKMDHKMVVVVVVVVVVNTVDHRMGTLMTMESSTMENRDTLDHGQVGMVT